MVVLVNPTKLTAGVCRPCKFLLLFSLISFLQLFCFVAELYARLLSLANGQKRLRGWRAWEFWSIRELQELQVKIASSSLFFILLNLLFYKDHAVLEKYHIITTYDTVKSEYVSYNPSAKDESKKSRASLKGKDADSDCDDSESDSFAKTKKSRSKGAKKSTFFKVKWWRSVLGATPYYLVTLKSYCHSAFIWSS